MDMERAKEKRLSDVSYKENLRMNLAEHHISFGGIIEKNLPDSKAKQGLAKKFRSQAGLGNE